MGENPWTIPASQETIAAARQGKLNILLTPNKRIPNDWLPPIPGLDILCLASGGGQQGPVLSAAGANVTVYDNSPRQLEQDRKVAAREGLELKTIEGDMRDLSVFPGGSFDLIIHPVSNVFVPEVLPVWKEAFRVLKPGGSLLSGFNNPLVFLFDTTRLYQGVLRVRYPLPYSDLQSLDEQELQAVLASGRPLEFSHTLETLIGGQVQAGFLIAGFYEDNDSNKSRTILDDYTSIYIATRAIKLKP